MDTHFKLDDLFTHLVARCSGPPGRAAAERWREAEPALADIASPLEALALCHDRCEPRRSNQALAALVRLGAHDELAALAALVALLPGLGSIAARLGHCGSLDAENLEADLAAAAWEVIRSRDAEECEWPATVILSRTRDRVRARIRAEGRRRALQGAAHELESLPASPGRPVIESLGLALGEICASNPSARGAAALVFATRVWGTTTAEAAARCGIDVAALRARRARAERRLVAMAQRGAVLVGALSEDVGVGGGGR